MSVIVKVSVSRPELPFAVAVLFEDGAHVVTRVPGTHPTVVGAALIAAAFALAGTDVTAEAASPRASDAVFDVELEGL